MVESFIWFIIPLIMIAVAFYIAFRINKIVDEYSKGMPYLIATVFSVFFFPVSVAHMQWLQIWLAPKVYLIEYAASLLKVN